MSVFSGCIRTGFRWPLLSGPIPLSVHHHALGGFPLFIGGLSDPWVGPFGRSGAGPFADWFTGGLSCLPLWNFKAAEVGVLRLPEASVALLPANEDLLDRACFGQGWIFQVRGEWYLFS